MSNDNRVTIRLSKEQYFLYEMRAAAKGMKMSAYVKSLLDENESIGEKNLIHEVLDSVKALGEKTNFISDIIADKKTTNEDKPNDANLDNVSMEILLILRAMAKPEQLKMAHARMREKQIHILNLEDY